MPRKPRFQPQGSCLHVVRRAHNRSTCFHDDGDRAHYLALLAQYALETRTSVHAYVLMSNHVHLLLTAGVENGASMLMYRVGLLYSKAVNRKRGRTGTLWEDRLHASEIRTDSYVLACYRYIELNPVRAGIVDDPGAYRWSSYACNAGGESTSWITRHPTMIALGPTPAAASLRYRQLFDMPIDETIVANLRTVGEPPGSRDVPRSGGQPDANWSSARRA
jgi:putative transposase